MKNFTRLFASVLLIGATLPAAALADGGWHEGQMVYSANGQRIAPIYRVQSDGSVQVIIDGKLTTIPAAALSVSGGKVISAKSKADLAH